MQLRCYLVTYDISSPKRWRRIFREMQGFGEHVQLSVFRCDLTAEQHAVLRSRIDDLIHHHEDQVLIIDLGKSSPAVVGGIEVLGRPRNFELPGPKIF